MGRRKGSKNIRHSLDPIVTPKESVKKQDICKHMNILSDFGFTKEEINSLFEDKDFESLRALDCFTSNVIRKMFTENEKAI